MFVLKRFWFIFFSLQPQFCSSIWVFWKKQASYHFLLGKHLTVYFQLIRKQEVWQSTLKENPPLNFFLFSWNGTMCPRSLFTQSWKYRETCLVNLKLGPDGKRSIFLLWKLDIFSFKPGGKTLVHFSLHCNNSFGHVLSYLKATGWLPLLTGKSSDSTVSSNLEVR